MAWAKDQQKLAYRCNGAHIRYLRKRMGWSQVQLKKASGYSERLIAKAEASGSIAHATLVDLAQSLSTKDQVIRPEELIYDPISIAKSLIHGIYVLQNEMISRVEHLIADNLKLEFVADKSKFPFAGSYVGVEGFRKGFELFFDSMTIPSDIDYTKCYDYFSSPERKEAVVVWGESWIHPVGMKFNQPTHVAQRIEFENGRISYLENCWDDV